MGCSNGVALWRMILCACVLRVLRHVESRNATSLEKLQRELLDGYETVLPSIHGEVVTAHLGITPALLVSLDGKQGLMRICMGIKMNWYDSRLRWDVQEYPGIYATSISPKLIWTPPVGITNSPTEPFDLRFYELFDAILDSSGFVSWNPFGQVETICTFNMVKFPYDEQECDITISPLALSMDILDVEPSLGFDMQYFTPSNEFDVISTKKEKNIFQGQEGGYNYSVAQTKFTLTFRRKPYYYLLSIIIPTMVLALLSTLTFLVPIDSGEKLSLGISILLAFAVLVLIVSELTPQTSENAPLIGLYLTVIVGLTGFNLFCQMLIMNLYLCEATTRMPLWLRNWTSCLSAIYCQQHHKITPQKAISLDNPNEESALGVAIPTAPLTLSNETTLDGDIIRGLRSFLAKMDTENQINDWKDEWKKLARLLDRTFLIITFTLNTIMILLYFIYV